MSTVRDRAYVRFAVRAGIGGALCLVAWALYLPGLIGVQIFLGFICFSLGMIAAGVLFGLGTVLWKVLRPAREQIRRETDDYITEKFGYPLGAAATNAAAEGEARPAVEAPGLPIAGVSPLRDVPKRDGWRR